jgi:hypothetical protein
MTWIDVNRATMSPTVPADVRPDTAPSETTELLPDPSSPALVGDDVGTQLAKIVLEAATRDRKMMRALRAEAESARCAAEKRQIEALRDKADAGFVAGVITGGTQVASGGMHAGGAGDGGKITEGNGSIASAAARHAADSADADATAEAHTADHFKAASEDARDAARDAGDLANKALAFYKEYVTAREDTKRAALLRA